MDNERRVSFKRYGEMPPEVGGGSREKSEQCSSHAGRLIQQSARLFCSACGTNEEIAQMC